MALSRDGIIDAAAIVLREQGLAGLSMRRLAQELGVQPGALYHHVASKQELLAAVGERLLSEAGDPAAAADDPARAAADLRALLLPIRDGAEVISFVHAYRPDALGPLRELHHSFAATLAVRDAHRAAETLIRYVLGFVAVEQNRAELVRARILETAADGTDVSGDSDALFTFGVQALLCGFAAADTSH